MAQLFRITKLHDTNQNQTFMFILPPATCQEHPPEILSRDVLYAGHKWRLSLSKKDKHLSPYLQIVNLVDGMRCWTDFGFVLINRESFTQNESFFEKQKEFNVGDFVHGRRTFVTLDDLNNRRFSDSKGEYLLEVNFKNPRTLFEQRFSMTPKTEQQQHRSAERPAVDYQRYDTKIFPFGELDWICVFCPNMDTTETGSRRHMLQITRKSRLDSLCKLTYRLTLGSQERGPGRFYRTDVRQEIFDFNGDGESLYFTEDYLHFVDEKTNEMKLTLELISVTYINQIKLNFTNVLNGAGENRNFSTQFADKDRQNWCIVFNNQQPPKSAAADDNVLIFTLLYPDLPNIPKNYLRYVCWTLRVLPKSPTNCNKASPTCASISATGTPFEYYYAQLEQDRGYVARVPLKLSELKTQGNTWLDEKECRLTIEIEWLCSYLLLHPSYHSYDDIYRKHVAQMRREVQALQAENYSLEKELHNYQMSIANKTAIVSGQRATPPPRTWSTDSANVVNNLDKCCLDDGRSSSSSNVISPSRPTVPPHEIAAQSPVVSSPYTAATVISNYDSQVQQKNQSPVRKRLPVPHQQIKQQQQKNFKLDPISCPPPPVVESHRSNGFTGPQVQNYNSRRQSTIESTDTNPEHQTLRRRVSERHYKSNSDRSIANHQIPYQSVSVISDRSKSVSPYLSAKNDNNGDKEQAAIYDRSNTFPYDDHHRYQSEILSQNTHAGVLPNDSRRRGRNVSGSFKARRNETWTFHYNNVA